MQSVLRMCVALLLAALGSNKGGRSLWRGDTQQPLRAGKAYVLARRDNSPKQVTETAQRLHRMEGTGIGLDIVERVILRMVAASGPRAS